jgi:hypothetical protein
MEKSAIISECGKYRYRLERTWDKSKTKVLFIMLNPSTANAIEDDATIRRCVNFAKEWGYGGLLVGNLFAYRSTKPKELLLAEDPIGPENLKHFNEMYKEAAVVICAWGNSGIVNKLGKKLTEYKPLKGWIGFLYYLDLAKDGTPKHPLYLKKDLIPQQLR